MLIRLCAAAIALAGCDTGVVVYFDVDPAIEWQELAVTVHDDRGNVVATPSVRSDVALPASIELVRGESSRGFLLLADLRSTAGCDTAECRFQRQRVRASYPGEGTGVIRVRFDAECSDLACGGGHTCIEGACRGACFATQDESNEARSAPAPCEVFVDGSEGADDPELCVFEARPCESLDEAIVAYSVPRAEDDGASNCYGRALSLESGPIVSVRGEDDAGAQIEYDNLDIRCQLSGTPEEPLIVRAWPGTGRPIVRGGLPLVIDSGNRSTENVVIEGFEATGARVTTACPDCMACTTGYEGWGVRVVGSNRNIVLRDLLVHDNDQGGIHIAQSPTGVSVLDSVVRDNRRGNTCFDEGGAGVLAAGTATGVVVRGSTFSGNAGFGLHIGAPSVIADNAVFDNGSGGIEVRGEASVRGNRVCNNGRRGIVVLGGTISVAVSHNAVVDHSETSISFLGATSGRVVDNVVAGGGMTGIGREDGTVEVHHNVIDGHATPLDPTAEGNWIVPAGTLSFVDRAGCDPAIENYDPAWVPETGARVGLDPSLSP